MGFFNGGIGARTAIAVLTAAFTAAGADQRPLQINVLEGDGAFNDIRKGVGRPAVVEVKDETGHAVENAKVVFQMPDNGASATFLDGSKTFVATSDHQGRAATPAIKPNKVEGPFAIVVTASKDGSTGRAEVRESNTLAGGSGGGAGHSSKGKIILSLVAAGAGVAGLAAHFAGGKSGGSTAAAGPAPTSLSVGTVTVGGPR